MTGFPGWALPWLRCPHCGGPLAGGDDTVGGDEPADASPGPGYEGRRGRDPGCSVVGCAAGHRFDVARHGYLPLLGPRARTDTGDDARMVAARAEFLAGGWYAPIASAVADAVAGGIPRGVGRGLPVVEVGAGTGYYLAAACAAGAGGIGPDETELAADPVAPPAVPAMKGLAIDASRYALRRAARVPGLAAVLADAWSPLPVRNGVAAAVLSVFAPRDPAELARIAGPDARIVVVTPEVDHLAELRGPLPLLAVDSGKAQRVSDSFAGLSVTALGARSVRYPVELPRRAVLALVSMGPTARHIAAGEMVRFVDLLDEPVRVTVSVTVTTLRPVG